jgi:transcriptional regulator with XRE-family HTH domain
MEEIGQTLHEARTRLGLTLEEAERSTRIRAAFLEALERGDLTRLPSPVQARGFLANYATYLGLDAEVILQRYSEITSSQRTRPFRRARLEELPTRPSVRVRPRRISADLLVAAVASVAVLAVLIAGFGRLAASLRERNQAASAFLIPTFTPAPEATEPAGLPPAAAAGASGTPTPALTLEPAPSGVVDLRLLVERRGLVIVEVDGRETYRGRPAVGELLEFQGQQLVKVTTGNGGGLRAFYRGEDQGLLGELDEVVIRFWSLAGPITPTPSPTPAPTVEA